MSSGCLQMDQETMLHSSLQPEAGQGRRLLRAKTLRPLPSLKPEPHTSLVDQIHASPAISLGSLNQAMVCAELAQRAYVETRLRLDLPVMPPGVHLSADESPRCFEARLVHSQRVADANGMDDFIQYGIWYVEHMGYVTAFRGSVHVKDWIANFGIGSAELEELPDVKVHAGIHTRVSRVSDTIVTAICKDAHNSGRLGDNSSSSTVPVVFTGEKWNPLGMHAALRRHRQAGACSTATCRLNAAPQHYSSA